MKQPVLTNGIVLRESEHDTRGLTSLYGEVYAPGEKEWQEYIKMIPEYTISNDKVYPVNYWPKSKKGRTIAAMKGSWPIYNEKLEDLNKYTNGSHKKRLEGQRKLRKILKKK